MDIQTPASHKNDPATSHEAEEKITKSGKRKTQQEQVLYAVQTFPGRTRAELAELANLDPVMVARRLSEVATAGKIKRGEVSVNCKVNKTKSITWWPV